MVLTPITNAYQISRRFFLPFSRVYDTIVDDNVNNGKPTTQSFSFTWFKVDFEATLK